MPLNNTKMLRAKKNLGQNFLTDISMLETIASAQNITNKHVLEIGPGYGALTEFLLQSHPASLDLVELDSDMIALLQQAMPQLQELSPNTHITLHHQDILQYSPPYQDYLVIANIPYYITNPILFHFLYPALGGNTHHTPDTMVIMMQKEVGERILARHNKKRQMSFLSLAMHLATTEIGLITYVPREAFSPVPKVDSIVLRFVLKKNRDPKKEQQLLELWRCAFTHPRKTLIKNLQGSAYRSDELGHILMNLGYTPQERAEAISLDDWHMLLDILIAPSE